MRPCDAGRRRVDRAVDGRQRLAREDEHGRLVVELHDVAPGLGDLVRVGGAEHEESRHRAQRRELLDRLVGRAVLADPDRVVREDVDHGDLHQRREPDRAARVVREDEEARPERAAASRAPARSTIGGGGELADAEVEVAAAALGGLEVACAVEGQARLRRRREVGRAADEPRHPLGDARSAPGRTSRGSRCPSRRPGTRGCRRPSRPAARGAACARSRRRDRGTRRGTPRTAPPTPCEPTRRARRSRPRSARTTPSGTRNSRILRPAVEALGSLDAVRPERLAVRLGRVLDRRAVADVAVHDDQRRPLVLGPERLERALGLRRGRSRPRRSSTFQPYAAKRAATSSVNVRSVCPSIVTRFES